MKRHNLLPIRHAAAQLEHLLAEPDDSADVILPFAARRLSPSEQDVQSWTLCPALPVLGRMFSRPFPSGAPALAPGEFAGALEIVRDGGMSLLRQFELGPDDRALLERCLRRARAEGAIVLSVRGAQADRTPLRALDTLRAQAARERRPGALVPQGGLAGLLRRLSITRAVVVAVRDWQWVDDESRRCLIEALTDGDPPRVLTVIASSVLDAAALVDEDVVAR